MGNSGLSGEASALAWRLQLPLGCLSYSVAFPLDLGFVMKLRSCSTGVAFPEAFVE